MVRSPGYVVIRIGLVLLVTALAAWLHLHAVPRLPLDYDELVYVPLAYRYGEMMEEGRWGEIPSFRENLEHPPLIKLLYAVQLRASGAEEPDWAHLDVGSVIPVASRPALWGPRTLSAAWGILQVLVIAAVNPLGGLLLAPHTYHIKYTAQAYLEGLPGLMAVLAVLLFELAAPRERDRSAAQRQRVRVPLLLLSAFCLGVAAGGKYVYALVGLALLPFLVSTLRRRWLLLLLYGMVTLAAFLLVNPFLWPNPPGRLWEALSFHWTYSQGDNVALARLPWWQPLTWLTTPAPKQWHPAVFRTVLADVLLLPLALVGIPWAVRRRPVWAAWAGLGLLFLLLWPTKWPQYILLVLPPLAVCGGIGLWEILRTWWRGWEIVA